VPVVIRTVGVLAAVMHDGITASVQSISTAGVLLAVTDVGTVTSVNDELDTIVGVLAVVVPEGTTD